MPKVWFEEGVNLVGTREFPGQPSNQVIINWAKTLKLDHKSDDIPWCGLFVAHCVGSTLPGDILPPNPLGAHNWMKFGDSCSPARWPRTAAQITGAVVNAEAEGPLSHKEA